MWLGGQIGLTGCLWVVSRFRWWSLCGLVGDLEDGVGLVFWGVWGIVLRIMLVSLGRLGCGLECDLLGGHWDIPGSGVAGSPGLVSREPGVGLGAGLPQFTLLTTNKENRD